MKSIKSESSSQISKNSNNSRYYKENNCYDDLSHNSEILDSSNSNSGNYKESNSYN